MPLLDAVRRIGGAVSGAALKMLAYSGLLVFDVDDFDVDVVTDETVRGASSAPGIGTGYIRVRVRSSAGGNVPETRTIQGDGDILVDGDAAAHDLTADRTISTSATVEATATKLAKRGDSGQCKFTTVVLNAASVPAGATYTDTQTAHVSADGNPRSWSGQDAASGAFDGGKVRFKGGDRGNSEHWAGDVEFSVGPEDDNTPVSGAFSLFTTADWSGTPFLKVVSFDSGIAKISCPSGLVLDGNIGFYGQPAAVRPSAYTQTYSATSRTMPASTGIDNAQAGTVYASVANLNELKEVVNSIIDDLQANGMFQ